MTLAAYTPSRAERIDVEGLTTEVFGMGSDSAAALARKLNLLNPRGQILIYGCAGALHPKLSAGASFLVHECKSITGESFRLRIPAPLEFFAQASVLTGPHVFTSSQEKSDAFKLSGCDLVDCESFYFMNELSERLHQQVTIIRTVIDPARQQLRFLKNNHVAIQKLWKPGALLDLAQMSWNFFIYHRKMKNILSQWMNYNQFS